MASILIGSGFKNLESLKEFSARFPNVASPLDDELEKIWICHKTPEEIPKFEDINSLPSEEYNCLSKKINKRINSSKDFLSFVTEFSPLTIFYKIYSQFKKELATYIFTKCYLFYNWGVSAFEPVLDHFEIHQQIQKIQKYPVKKNRRKVIRNLQGSPKFPESHEAKGKTKSREKSVDLFEEPVHSVKSAKKRMSFKVVKKAIENAEKFYDLSKSSNNAYHETFNLDKILYDMKQNFQWPQTHVLCKNSTEDLIAFIVHMPLATTSSIEKKLINDHKNWLILRKLLERFIKQHEIINKNNGYGRILIKHLKKVKVPPERRLVPIPKSVICSYVVDILRRVLPIELFGSNHVRKNFFRGVIKVINGAKNQNFIWYPLLRLLLKNESKLSWCSELGDYYTRSQMILKLFKFLVVHYVFVLLKNNFYITETGLTGFGLRFYRKNDMESLSFIYLRDLLSSKHIRPLKRQDYEEDSVERRWLETGRINTEDLKIKLKEFMGHNCEYRQPITLARFLPKSEKSDELRIVTAVGRRMRKELTAGNKNLEKIFRVRLFRRKKKLFFVRLLLEFMVDKYGSGIRAQPGSAVLEAAWKKAVDLKESFGNLFFIKADIANAFGSVKYSILSEVLKKILEEESRLDRIQLKKIIEWKKTKWKIEKVVRFSFGNRPRENSIMINRSICLHQKKKINLHYDRKFLEIIKQVVMMQRIQIKGRIFRVIKGLSLGGAGIFSSQLNEIYYSSMDRNYFLELVNPSDSILLRAVDDYMFITPKVDKARKFLEIVQTGIDHYGVRFNGRKLVSNLIGDNHQVSYLGLVFDFDDMSVKPNYAKYQHMGLLSSTKLFDQSGNAHFNKSVFLERKSMSFNCLKLHSIVLNNGNLKTIRQTIFEACMLQSVRVITFAEYLYSGCIKNDLAVYKILLKSCNRIWNRVAGSALSRDEFTWLFFFAATTVLKRWSGQFKVLFIIARFKLQKCEKDLTNIGSELLLDFLKDDLLEKNYWDRVNTLLRDIKKRTKD